MSRTPQALGALDLFVQSGGDATWEGVVSAALTLGAMSPGTIDRPGVALECVSAGGDLAADADEFHRVRFATFSDGSELRARGQFVQEVTARWFCPTSGGFMGERRARLVTLTPSSRAWISPDPDDLARGVPHRLPLEAAEVLAILIRTGAVSAAAVAAARQRVGCDRCESTGWVPCDDGPTFPADEPCPKCGGVL
jgi:hypothetical protein